MYVDMDEILTSSNASVVQWALQVHGRLQTMHICGWINTFHQMMFHSRLHLFSVFRTLVFPYIFLFLLSSVKFQLEDDKEVGCFLVFMLVQYDFRRNRENWCVCVCVRVCLQNRNRRSSGSIQMCNEKVSKWVNHHSTHMNMTLGFSFIASLQE